MSTFSNTSVDPEELDKEKVRELALSDRDSAPVYRVLFRDLYGEEP